MDVGLAMPSGNVVSPDAVGSLVLDAERAGFASVWFPDHIAIPVASVESGEFPGLYLEALTACVWSLGATTRIRAGTDVMVAAYRHPLLVRAMIASAAVLSRDRLVLGVGVGHLRGEFEALGAPPIEQRGATADRVLRTLRTGERGLVQVERRVPLWVGGNHDNALRRAALLGDGWQPLFPSLEVYAAAIARIKELRAEAGVTEQFTFSYSTAISRIVDKAPAQWPVIPPAPGTYAPAIPVHDDNRPWFVGTLDDVVSDLQALESVGGNHIVLRLRGDNVSEEISAAADLIHAVQRGGPPSG